MRPMRGLRVGAAGLLLLALAGPVAAADGDVIDEAAILGGEPGRTAASVVDAYAALTGGRMAVVTRTVGSASAESARSQAQSLLRTLEIESGVVFLVEVEAGDCAGAAAVAATRDVAAALLTADEIDVVTREVQPWIERCQAGAGTSIGLARLMSFSVGDVNVLPPAEPTGPGSLPAGVPAAGPPFPDPVAGRAVYDYADVLRPETEAAAETTIDAIEARTGAEVVVYTQVVDYGITTEEAEAHAIALIDQWGVGRRGFDDGLVILFDMDPSLEHGEVQLYAAPGYREAYLTNQERQRIFDEDMLPRLRRADMDGALAAALEKLDAATTPENAARLQAARQVDAAIGLVGAPIVLFGLVGWATWSWMRYGRDPEYLDDPSIHIPAPPPELTPAAGALVFDGRTSRRALTAALLDLASRGRLSFREERGLLGLGRKVGIETGAAVRVDPGSEWQREKAARRPLSAAEETALRRLESIAQDGVIEPERVIEFGPHVGEFDQKLEAHVVSRGWFREPPAKAVRRWIARATVALFVGIGVAALGFNLPSAGLVMLGGSAVVGAVVIFAIARLMPARTMAGAMIRAMLAAYRRTLEKTMAQARSMNQVVEEARLSWLETPDQVVVWGVALGLQSQVEEVLERSVSDLEAGRAAAGTYVPTWYHHGSGGGGSGLGGGGGSLLSSSPIPNVGGMMAALGTIGNSPSSSGDGGGFGGGSSGGGGGGAGGGF